MEKNLLPKDPYNIVITGVGGQGNVMASRVLSNMMVKKGLQVTIGETFGASQRGSSVVTNIRISAKGIWSPQMPVGRADVVISVEPVEAIRVLKKFGNDQVRVLTNTRPIYPLGVITGDEEYPDFESIQKTTRDLSARAWFIDATDIAVELGNPILANIVMIGALSEIGDLPMDRDEFKTVLLQKLSEDKLAVNLKAFDAGALACKERQEGEKSDVRG